MPLSRQPLVLRLAMRFLSQWSTSSLGKTEASRSVSLLSLTSSWVTCLSRSGSSGTMLEILFNLTEGAGRRQRFKYDLDAVERHSGCGLSCKAGNMPQVMVIYRAAHLSLFVAQLFLCTTLIEVVLICGQESGQFKLLSCRHLQMKSHNVQNIQILENTATN